MQKYYLDTSIWLDLFEDKNQPGFPKGEYVNRLIYFIMEANGKIVISNATLKEIWNYGHIYPEFKIFLRSLRKIIIFVRYSENQFRRARDISKKRQLPHFDALHAIIARDSRSIMVTRDRHFNDLKDIVVSLRPEDITG
jgi:predicted nucleic acid-binding protein